MTCPAASQNGPAVVDTIAINLREILSQLRAAAP
jgi:hypothetical protein